MGHQGSRFIGYARDHQNVGSSNTNSRKSVNGPAIGRRRRIRSTSVTPGLGSLLETTIVCLNGCRQITEWAEPVSRSHCISAAFLEVSHQMGPGSRSIDIDINSRIGVTVGIIKSPGFIEYRSPKRLGTKFITWFTASRSSPGSVTDRWE